ncbi:hypothetical protein ACFFGH_12980 [Lysobacter korlensis]|uniref:Uncharacterized protein n=1 Tax=Lysobacter korlensis TaxID=553636 RepID=A0ABV6RP41_9GAMM
MSDTTASDDTSDPTGTQHLGTDSDPLASGTAVPSDADPASTIPMQADGGRPDGDPAALANDGQPSTEVASGTPQSIVPPTQNSDDPRT